MKKSIQYIFYMFLFTAMPVTIIAGILLILRNPEAPPAISFVLIGIGILLCLFNKGLTKRFNALRYDREYDEFGNRKGMADYMSLSKKERAAIDKQKLADAERVLNSSALKKMTHPGSTSPDADLEHLIGLSAAKKQMQTIAARMEFDREKQKGGMQKETNARHMVFSGPPGTGKTTVARIMTGFLYKNKVIKKNLCVEVDGNYLKASTPADTSLKTDLIIRSAYDGVLFIDEAYAVSGSEAAISTLIKKMEDNRGRFVLILAGYTNEMQRLIKSNPGFASRIKDYIEFEQFTAAELEQIFVQMSNDNGMCVSADAIDHFRIRISEEKKRSSFGNARTVRNLVDESISNHAFNLRSGALDNSSKYTLQGIDVNCNPSKFGL